MSTRLVQLCLALSVPLWAAGCDLFADLTPPQNIDDSDALCVQDFYVLQNMCTPCPDGTRRDEGDDPTLADTACDPVVCEQDQFVQSNACAPCPDGLTRPAGDLASGPDTQCEENPCQGAQINVNGTCLCPAGTSSPACDPVLCPEDERVEGNLCVPCPAGRTNEPGDDASKQDTACDATPCEVDEFVLNNTCEVCPVGEPKLQGDDPSGEDTYCLDACHQVFGVDCLRFEEQYIKSSDPGAGDEFGLSVAIEGDTMVVGAPLENNGGTGINPAPGNDNAQNSGAVYVYKRAGNVWTQTHFIKASDAKAREQFGFDVALEGDTMAVSARTLSNEGKVYMFEREDDDWVQTHILKGSYTRPNHRFGFRIDLVDGRLVAGAAYDGNNAQGVAVGALSSNGAVYVFEQKASTWPQTAYLKAPVLKHLDEFGISTATSAQGGWIAVGAHKDDRVVASLDAELTNQDSGAVYMYRKEANEWAYHSILKPSNLPAGAGFGSAVSIEGDVLAVGAKRENTQGANAGAAYVYVYDVLMDRWDLRARVVGDRINEEDEFGLHVHVSDGRVFVSAHLEDANGLGLSPDGEQDENAKNSGAVYVFEPNAPDSPEWLQIARIKAPNAQGFDIFGSDLDVDGSRLVVGAYHESGGQVGIPTDNNASRAGAAYVFRLAP